MEETTHEQTPQPSSHPSKPTTPTPTPTLSSLRAWSHLYLSKTDRTLNSLSQITSTPTGQDKVLLLLGYSSLLTSSVLQRISLARLQHLSSLLIKRATSLPPNTAIVISTSDLKIPSSRLLVLAARLKALSSVISDFRIFVRLFGLLGIYGWGKDVWQNPPRDGVEESIVKAQVIVNFFFQILENGAYLASKNVLNWSESKQNKAWLWSSRFWASHVLLEFLRLGRVWNVHNRELQAGKGKEKQVDADTREAEWKREWVKSLVVNSAWAPLTLHWSTEGGLISDAWVGAFGSLAGIIGVGRLLRNA